MPSNAPTAKPTRQPQACIASLPSQDVSRAARPVAAITPTVTLTKTELDEAAPLGRRDFSDVGIGHAGLAAVRQARVSRHRNSRTDAHTPACP